MTSFQRIIKYIAITFAGLLSIFIISSCIFGLSLLIGILDGKNDSVKEMEILKDNIENVNELEIDLNASKLAIKNGNEFKIESNNDNVNVNVKNNKLIIKETKKYIRFNDNNEVVVYIPDHYLFERVDIDCGAGIIKIDELYVNNLDADFGAGESILNNLRVNNSADLDFGAGSVKIKDSVIFNSDLDLGVGKFEFTGLLLGNNKIDSGVGETNINLEDILDNYRITVEKGIGNIKIDNQNVKNNTTVGNGNNYIDIDGGIGSININFN